MKLHAFTTAFFLFLGLCSVLPSTQVAAQSDTTKQTTQKSDFAPNSNQANNELLPAKFLITQHILWGKKGLMRNFHRFELNPENRERELKLRWKMFTAHQIIGIGTLCGMIGQGIVGSQLYAADKSSANYKNIRNLHEGIAMGVNVGYFTTAGLALLAPPRMPGMLPAKGNVKVHRILAIIHLSSMIATNILADQIEGNPDLKPWHRAAAFTAFGSYTAAIAFIKF